MIRKEIQLLIDRLNQNHPRSNIEDTPSDYKEDSSKQTVISAIKQHNSNHYWPPIIGTITPRPQG